MVTNRSFLRGGENLKHPKMPGETKAEASVIRTIAVWFINP